MGRAGLFFYHYLVAKLRLRWFEFAPDFYRKFHLALALPRWREFPFYRGINGGLESFPEMNKTKLLSNFVFLNRFGARYDECLEAGLAQEKSRDFLTTKLPYSIGLSSGTSGRCGVFLTTERERIRWAATILAHAGFLPLRKKQRVAFFLRANSPLYEQAGGTRLQFRFFDLARDFRELLPELRAYNPTVLIGPPALLKAVREADGAERLTHPEVVVSVADKLEKDDRARLEAHFGRKIFEVYQATEGFLGISCREGLLHLNEDLHFIERRYIDDTRTAFEPLISDYFRHSQALVRFRLDDVLIPLGGTCACGSRRQAIREVRGRADDVLLFAGVNGSITAIPPDFVRHAIQNHLESDLDFKVIQDGTRLQIQLESEPAAAALARASNELRGFLASRGIEPPPLDWSFSLRRGLGDKRKRVERR
ncbi:MAG: F390 synthetase-related protein [Bdellovibrionota bacterium]